MTQVQIFPSPTLPALATVQVPEDSIESTTFLELMLPPAPPEHMPEGAEAPATLLQQPFLALPSWSAALSTPEAGAENWMTMPTVATGEEATPSPWIAPMREMESAEPDMAQREQLSEDASDPVPVYPVQTAATPEVKPEAAAVTGDDIQHNPPAPPSEVATVLAQSGADLSMPVRPPHTEQNPPDALPMQPLPPARPLHEAARNPELPASLPVRYPVSEGSGTGPLGQERQDALPGLAGIQPYPSSPHPPIQAATLEEPAVARSSPVAGHPVESMWLAAPLDESLPVMPKAGSGLNDQPGTSALDIPVKKTLPVIQKSAELETIFGAEADTEIPPEVTPVRAPALPPGPDRQGTAAPTPVHAAILPFAAVQLQSTEDRIVAPPAVTEAGLGDLASPAVDSAPLLAELQTPAPAMPGIPAMPREERLIRSLWLGDALDRIAGKDAAPAQPSPAVAMAPQLPAPEAADKPRAASAETIPPAMAPISAEGAPQPQKAEVIAMPPQAMAQLTVAAAALPHGSAPAPHKATEPPTAPSAQVQIVQALSPGGSPVTELQLSPEELGHVKIDMRRDGDRLVMTITAERQDTLDLLRRHSGELAADLRAAGHSGLDLSFGRWSGPGADAGGQAPPEPSSGQPQSTRGESDALVSLVSPDQASAPQGSGLYLRI